MTNKGKWILAAAAAVLLCLFHPWTAPSLLAEADAEVVQEDWKEEFDAICSKTQDAMTFTTAELKSLVERSDRLKPRIQKLDETRRKVYLRRLALCRDLFIFVLETKERKD